MSEKMTFSEDIRLLEALLFAAPEPLSIGEIEKRITLARPVETVLDELLVHYEGRGIVLQQIGKGWAFRTAVDLGPALTELKVVQKKLSKAAMETLAIIAYHQPVTRAEVEEVRGVQVSKGTVDVLLETGWIKMRGRRRAPGRPITYGTTGLFLDQFGFSRLDELPGLNELKGAGLLSGALPPGFDVPRPALEEGALLVDELPLEEHEAQGGEEDPLKFKQDGYFEDDK